MAKHPVEELAEMVGGTITEIGALPDGSGFATMSMPLPEKHWLYESHYNIPPMPFRMGYNDPRRGEFNDMVRKAARYAVRASTMNGAAPDFDPDAMVQNFVVAMLGYHTPNGLSECDPESNPSPVPDPYPGAPA